MHTGCVPRSMLTGNADDPDIVRDHLDRALAEDADYADAHSHLGLLFVAQRRFKEALGALQTAVRLKPDDPLTRYNLGVTYASLGQTDRAAVAFRDAIRLKPDDPITTTIWVFYTIFRTITRLLLRLCRRRSVSSRISRSPI